ncbi:MAG TPA: N-acetyltransferase [Deinococcales bacterium]|nr:N-acetyltransferase [Deinococcales bacterium]
MIRPATPDDHQPAATLVWEANGSVAQVLAGSGDPAESLTLFHEAFQARGNRLSFENSLVTVLDGRVVGVLVAYHGSQWSQLDRPFRERLARLGRTASIPREARDDEFYLDSLAVDATFRGRGLGRELLAAFEQLGRERAHGRLGLLVDPENARARRLYESAGFQPDHMLRIGGHAYQHMTRAL